MHPALLLFAPLILAGCTTTLRPPEPPAGAPYQLPPGAITLNTPDSPGAVREREQLLEALRKRLSQRSDRDESGRPVYRILAISGGGSNGAFGAGLLTGWTQSGTRPEFDVVTGISTGALMATFAFLGPDHDADLGVYTRISDSDIYNRRSLLRWLRNDAMNDTAPLRDLVREMIDEAILARVAAEYRAGRRLFIGTTNLDSNTFTLWDMGAIATSDRPDRLEHYRSVVLASASAPVIFSPVYIAVQGSEGTYWQMHADGGMKEGIMTYGVMQEPLEILRRSGYGPDDMRLEIHGIYNGRQQERGTYKPVAPSVSAIAIASTSAMLRNVTDNSLYRMWLKAQLYNMHLYLTWIPEDAPGPANSFEFDNAAMKSLFQYARELAGSGAAWRYIPPTEADARTPHFLDPDLFLNRLETPPR